MKAEEGKKFDQGKADYSLLPPMILEEVVKVLTYGALNKYGRDNWRKVDDAPNRYFAAAQRHLWAIRKGEIHDPETGYLHIAHAICCMMFLGEPILEFKTIDEFQKYVSDSMKKESDSDKLLERMTLIDD